MCEVPFDYIASETQGGLGGTCVLRGCVPKKLLSYGGEFVNDFKAAEGYGYAQSIPHKQPDSPQHQFSMMLHPPSALALVCSDRLVLLQDIAMRHS